MSRALDIVHRALDAVHRALDAVHRALDAVPQLLPYIVIFWLAENSFLMFLNFHLFAVPACTRQQFILVL